VLDFSFSDKFIDGTAVLNIKRGKDVGFVSVDKVGNGYQLPVKSSLLSQVGDITFQFVVTTPSGTIMKFDSFVMTVEDAIDTNVPIPDQYPTWIEMANTKLAEIDKAVNETEKALKELDDEMKSANQAIHSVLQAKNNGEFDGYSPTVTERTNTDVEYILTISYRDGNGKIQTYDTPNLKGTGGGGVGTEKDPTVPNHVKAITLEDIIKWNNKSEFSGDYNDLANKPETTSIINALTANLETNKLYRGAISQNTTFILPTVSDNTILNTVQVQVTISNYDSITIDLGTTKFFGNIPELGNGSYILYYEYDGSNWCVGALPVVSEV
jgi:hypothetical protein